MKYYFFISVVTCGLASQVSAGTTGPVPVMPPAIDCTWVASLSAGPVWAGAGKMQTIFLTPEIEKTYAARKSNHALAAGELFIGIQGSLSSQWLGQLGLAGAMTDDAKLQGVIWDDAEPQFDNYSYRYRVWNNRVGVKGKLLLEEYDQGYWFMPWVSASLGVGFNGAHDFTSTPLIFEALPTPNFRDHTKIAFTYTLGLGLQKVFTPNWQVGVGYEFADWGKSGLGRAFGQTLNTGLALNHLYTNGVLFNLTYVA